MNKNFLWIPRILTIIFILFISLFALDSFTGEEPLMSEILSFALHLIPSALLTAILFLSWKKPVIGGAALTGAGIFFTLYFGTYANTANFFLISFPFILAGSMFIIFSVFSDKKNK